MSYVVRLVGLVSGRPTAFDGKWLVEYDPNRDGVDPEGHPMMAHIVATDDRANARVFADVQEVHALWTRVDERAPVRADGKPNRPLTAFTIGTEPL